MLLMIDNHDSFTWNLVQYFQELGVEVETVANDAITVDQVLEKRPQYIVISPGPCTPDQAGISLRLVKACAGKIPLLGVCLGHQTIAQSFGSQIVRAQTLIHGKTSAVHHQEEGIFSGLPSPFKATRYHSLVVEAQSLSKEFELTAWLKTDNGAIGDIMGIKHRYLPMEGVQFHPESILSEHGHQLLRNFVQLYANVADTTHQYNTG